MIRVGSGTPRADRIEQALCLFAARKRIWMGRCRQREHLVGVSIMRVSSLRMGGNMRFV